MCTATAENGRIRCCVHYKVQEAMVSKEFLTDYQTLRHHDKPWKLSEKMQKLYFDEMGIFSGICMFLDRLSGNAISG